MYFCKKKMMYRYFTRLFLLGFLIQFASCASMKPPANPDQGLLGEAIIYLSDDKLRGRETGTQGEKLAAEYIAGRYKEIGLSPKGDEGSYYQKFTGYDSQDAHGHGDGDMAGGQSKPVHGRNVVGFMDNGAAYTVVIGAHYDHLGMGGFGSLYEGPAEIHNGADDNASGVAVMLYLAKKLKAEGQKCNYLFIAFSGEEKGLWGSNYWTKNPTYAIDKISYMINLDMVGRLKDNRLAINGTGTSPQWSVLDKEKKKFDLVKSESGIGPSDHTSFYLKGIPSIHFFTGQHADYHKPTDDYDKVNFAGCYEVSFYILRIIKRLGGKKLEFTKTKDESTDTPAFKVTLGVIPDYMFQDKGMRIDGVRAGKTADTAGILDGDVVVKMGDLKIVDMNSYMKALSVFEPGEKVMVVVLREGKELKKEVTFQ